MKEEEYKIKLKQLKQLREDYLKKVEDLKKEHIQKINELIEQEEQKKIKNKREEILNNSF